MSEQESGPGVLDANAEVPEPRPGRRRLLIGLALAAAAVAVTAAVTIAVTGDQPSAGATTASATTTPAPRSTAAATPPAIQKSVSADPTVSADVIAGERAELAATAALLDTPLALHSPALWDQWLPEGKPYPGASTEEEMSTCPRLAADLGAALGVRMSYWTGTLPGGGCTWATVPLSYDGPYDYAYLLTVGYLADGTTTEDWRHHFYEHGGAVCPDVDVPAVGRGAVLVRCENDAPGYVLVLADQRRDGVWLLQADARTDAAHPASYALMSLLDGVAGAYG